MDFTSRHAAAEYVVGFSFIKEFRTEHYTNTQTHKHTRTHSIYKSNGNVCGREKGRNGESEGEKERETGVTELESINQNMHASS